MTKFKPIYYSFFLLFLFTSLFAQKTQLHLKFDPLLKVEILKHPNAYSQDYLPEKSHDITTVIVETTDQLKADDLQSFNGKISSQVGRYVTMRLPKSALYILAALPKVKQIHFDAKLYPNNERAIQLIKADSVHAGLGNLPEGYSGKGVVVGVIDSGVDFLHEDFRNPQDPTQSRIAYIWDQQNPTGTAPVDYGYGTEWAREQIESELTDEPANIMAPIDTCSICFGHGTHVTGTAAGNNGIAYESEIIVVASTLQWSEVLDGMQYIIQKAEAMDMPCVINMSFGTSLSPHDGLHFASYWVDNILEGTTGVATCIAAGNQGDRYTHWGGFELEEDSSVVYAAGIGGHGLHTTIQRK